VPEYSLTVFAVCVLCEEVLAVAEGVVGVKVGLIDGETEGDRKGRSSLRGKHCFYVGISSHPILFA
jgi:hypothetical protein